MNDFFQKLNSSPWRGCVAEIGLGVPFTAWLLNHAGASKVLLHMECPYSKEYQVKYDLKNRSVSKQFVNSVAAALYKDALDKGLGDNLFTLCVSGSHKTPEESGETHGWICIRYGIAGESQSFMHFTMPKILFRHEAIKATGELIQEFLQQVLFRERPWNEVLQGHKFMDVVEDRDMTIQAHLGLNDPLYYYGGEFRRPVDVIRNETKFYPGSFNPPTIAHDFLGSNAVYVLNRWNVRKGRISSEDLAHRIAMLDLLGKKVLITSTDGLISGLHRFLVKNGAKAEDLSYVLGTDTYNLLRDPIYVTDDFNVLAKEATFLVHERPGYPIKELGLRTVKVVTPPKMAELSSSTARISGEGLDASVASYVKEHHLYEALYRL